MKSSYHHISTIGIGAVMSAGFLILASGKQGERYVGKNTGIKTKKINPKDYDQATQDAGL